MTTDFDPRNISEGKDKDLDGIIRPQDLQEFTGQDKIVANLKIFVAAAKMRGESLDHVLFHDRAEGEKLIEEKIEGDFAGGIFENEIDHFIDCIRNDKTPSSNIEQAVQLQAMLMGIYESSKAGHEIKLNY